MDGATILKHHERWRLARAFMYLGLVLAGLCAVFFPSELVKEQVGSVVVFFWSFGLALSALTCLYGSLSDRWIGEYTGLPLLWSVLGLYGLSALLGAGWNPSPLFAYGLVVLSFSSGLIARWQDVRDSKRRADRDQGGSSEE